MLQHVLNPLRRIPVAAYLFMALIPPFFLAIFPNVHGSNDIIMPDLRAILCAGNSRLHGEPIYALADNCPFGRNITYVYPPIVAAFMSYLQGRLGTNGEWFVFGGLFSLAFYAIFKLIFSGSRADLANRIPFTCAMMTKSVSSANISLLFHSALLVACVRDRSYYVLSLLLALIIVCKLTFAPYLFLFVFLDGSLLRRAGMFALTSALVGCYFLWFYVSDPALFAEWTKTAAGTGLSYPGDSFLSLAAVASIQSLAIKLMLYLALTVVLVSVAAFAQTTICETSRDRIYFGIAICVLLNPRMFTYDFCTLLLGMGVVSKYMWSALGRFRAVWVVAMALVWTLTVSFGTTNGARFLWVACVVIVLATSAYAAALAWEERRGGLSLAPSS